MTYEVAEDIGEDAGGGGGGGGGMNEIYAMTAAAGARSTSYTSWVESACSGGIPDVREPCSVAKSAANLGRPQRGAQG